MNARPDRLAYCGMVSRMRLTTRARGAYQGFLTRTMTSTGLALPASAWVALWAVAGALTTQPAMAIRRAAACVDGLGIDVVALGI